MSNEIILERVDEVSNEVAKEEWYNEIRNCIVTMGEVISRGQDMKQLLSQYDDLWLKMMSKTEEKFYARAFCDGVEKAKEQRCCLDCSKQNR